MAGNSQNPLLKPMRVHIVRAEYGYCYGPRCAVTNSQYLMHNISRYQSSCHISHILSPGLLSNSYTMACPPVRGDNPRALASGRP